MEFDSQEFKDLYEYDGNDLGSSFSGRETVFKVWSPTADCVELNLFKDDLSSSPYKKTYLNKTEHGIWQCTDGCRPGTYYTYSIHFNNSINEVTDPYAKAAGSNGLKSMVVDLSETNPEGFNHDSFVKCKSPSDAIIWEIHVRDFSNKIKTCQYRGKYLAFTEKGLVNSYGQSVGLDYLKKLGITHVQLQPVFDFGSGDENSPDTWYNWGYDPANYNLPEGSYSTNPHNGAKRIKELKSLVMALHNEGIGVIMDVVYNHTFLLSSNLGKTVPYYYYRYRPWGEPSNGSGCGNEIATERCMVRNYIVQSLMYWMTEYHIDGFRFDLMGLIDIDTMNLIEKELHSINPDALLYGEPWTGGDSVLPHEKRSMREGLTKLHSIGVFNDSIRDTLKGNTFNVYDKGYINGSNNQFSATAIIVNMLKINVINYMSCHDNYTLWDKLTQSVPDAEIEDLVRINCLGAGIIMLSKGTPFFLAGEEFLRTKHCDPNSYKSCDEVNNIDWEVLKTGSQEYKCYDFYRNLCRIRRENPFIANSEMSFSILNDDIIKVTYSDGAQIIGYAIINPENKSYNFTVPRGTWKCLVNDFCYEEKELIENTSVEIKRKSIFLIRN